MTKIENKLKVFSDIFYSILKETGFGISEFSNTRLMLLLYLTCLESTKISDDNLFKCFDNFIAYPSGPFEEDVYSAIDIIPGFEYENGHFRSIISDYTFFPSKIIEDSVKRLVHDLPNNDKETLIDLVHKLSTWKDGYMNNPYKKVSLNEEDLLKDYIIFKELI